MYRSGQCGKGFRCGHRAHEQPRSLLHLEFPKPLVRSSVDDRVQAGPGSHFVDRRSRVGRIRGDVRRCCHQSGRVIQGPPDVRDQRWWFETVFADPISRQSTGTKGKGLEKFSIRIPQPISESDSEVDAAIVSAAVDGYESSGSSDPDSAFPPPSIPVPAKQTYRFTLGTARCILRPRPRA